MIFFQIAFYNFYIIDMLIGLSFLMFSILVDGEIQQQ